MQHVQTLTKFSDECLLVSIKYLDRYNLSNEHFSLNSYNVHRIWLACIILATKFQDDHFYNNKAF